MKLKIKKIIPIIILILLVIQTTCLAVNPLDTDFYKPQDLKEKDYKKAFELTTTIVTGLTIVGTVVAILGIMLLGIKYMLGSVEEKAEYKKSMIPYLIGCIFIFAISQIVSIIYSIVSQI